MVESVLSRAGEVVLYPYPHVVIKDCLRGYKALSDTFPEDRILPEKYGEGQRIDMHSRDVLKTMDGPWREFVGYHTSPAFWREVFALFRDAIHLLYPLLGMQYGDPERWICGVRGLGDSTMRMECQPGVNTPQSERMRVRGPHLDNPVELYGGMLYMGEGEGDLEIQRLVRPPMFHGKLEIADECVETVETVKYEPNTFVMFLNSPFSVHAVTPRNPTDKCRRLVNFCGELPAKLFTTGHGRY